MFTMRRAAFALLLLGVVAAAGAHLSNSARQPTKLPFIMESRQIYRDARGGEQLQATDTRWQGSNGAWKSVTNYLDSAGNVYHTMTTYSVPGQGVYTVRGGKLVFVSEAPVDMRWLTMEELRQRPTFVREDKVLGYDAAVVNTGGNGEMVSQAFVVPRLQGIPVKLTDFTPNGEGTIMEPVRIELIEPPADTFRLPNLPEDHSYYRDKQARAASKSGNK